MYKNNPELIYPNKYHLNTPYYYPYTRHDATHIKSSTTTSTSHPDLKDYGPQPFVVNLEDATKANENFRTALWTGGHLQLTLMSLHVGEDIGLEIHPNLDQFIRIEQGNGMIMMGDTTENLTFQAPVTDGFAFIIPAGTWHNLMNTGSIPLKLYSIYAPVQHPHGTIHVTKADANSPK